MGGAGAWPVFGLCARDTHHRSSKVAPAIDGYRFSISRKREIQSSTHPTSYANRPWQCLYFLPEPHGQASLRPTLPQLDGSLGLRAAAAAAAPEVMPARASVSAPARASASSSSPVEGSSLCASM